MKYEHHLFICTNKRPENDARGCCAAKGSEEIVSFFKEELSKRGLKGKVRANAAGCLDACAMGPSVVIYPEGVWYTVRSREEALAVIDRHLMRQEIIEEMLMPAPWAKGQRHEGSLSTPLFK